MYSTRALIDSLIEKYVFITVYLFLSRSLGFKTSNKTILTRALIEKSVVLLGLKTELPNLKTKRELSV